MQNIKKQQLSVYTKIFTDSEKLILEQIQD